MFFNKDEEITGSVDKDLIPKKENIYTYFPQYAEAIKNNINAIDVNDYSKHTVPFVVGSTVCRITYVPTLDWYMFSYVPLTYNMIRNKMVRSVFLLIYFTIWLAITLFMVFVLRITHPLVDLKKTMNTVSEGNFTASFVFNRDDEIGSLSKGLSHITQTVCRIIKDTHTHFASVHTINSDTQEQLTSCIHQSEQIVSELQQSNILLSDQQKVISHTSQVAQNNNNDINILGPRNKTKKRYRIRCRGCIE